MAVCGVRRFVSLCLLVLTGVLLTAHSALAASGLGEKTPLHLPAGHTTTTPQTTVTSPTISGGSVVKTFIVLVLVVALIYGLARLARRFNPTRFPKLQASGEIEVLATQALFQGRLLHVVRVGDKVMVLGSTDQSVSRLASLNEEDIESMLALRQVKESSKAPASSFRGALAGAVSARTTKPTADEPRGSWLERLKDMTSR